jgi:hypothetical protein
VTVVSGVGFSFRIQRVLSWSLVIRGSWVGNLALGEVSAMGFQRRMRNLMCEAMLGWSI